MKLNYRSFVSLMPLLIISACGEVNEIACNSSHPFCKEAPTISIKNTSRSEAIHTVNIVEHCATSWSSSETKGVGKGDTEIFEVGDGDVELDNFGTPKKEYFDVRVLYNNGTCDFKHNVEVSTGETEISVYRTHANCPAPCS